MAAANPLCAIPGCKSWAKANGRCTAHNIAYDKKLTRDGSAVTPAFVPVVVAKVIKGDGYYGGSAKQPHVHVYPGGAHLKLPHRYNLVADGKRHVAAAEAYAALDGHKLESVMKPWVHAALKYFGVDEVGDGQ